MNDALNCGEPYPCAFKPGRAVQTLEDAKQFVDVLHIEANPIVSNEYHHPIVSFLRASYLNLGLRVRSGELYSIGKKSNTVMLVRYSKSIAISTTPSEQKKKNVTIKKTKNKKQKNIY